MGMDARRRMLREAAAGIDALNAWIGDALEQADGYENAGEESLATEMRDCVTAIWPLLNGALPSLIGRELHAAMAPTHGALLDPIPS